MAFKAILRQGKESSVVRRHPWVFSGAIKRIVDENEQRASPEEGAWIEVYSNDRHFLGAGFYALGSIAIRIITFQHKEVDSEFWKNRIAESLQLRKSLKLINEQNNIFRLIHGDGDGFPGLIIDMYNGNAVIQAHAYGIHLVRHDISNALQQVFGSELQSIYYKSKETLPASFEVENEFLFGEVATPIVASEYDCKYQIDWVTGQKTGFFIDQRENRKLIGEYSQGKKVLNTFCYSGGFSLAALKNGATEVHSVDASEKAIVLTDNNILLNGFEDKHQSFAIDTFKFFEQEADEDYDVVVLDPPAFAKHQNVKHKAVQGYKRLNATALKFIKPGGILFTFSCSQVIDRKLFYNTIMAAAIQAKREVRVLHHLSQPADHPVNIFHPEGEYLKGLVLYVGESWN